MGARGHGDKKRYSRQRGQHRETGIYAAGVGRAVIAMTAVHIGALVQAGKVTDQPEIRPPTDVMAITSLPYARPIIRFPSV